MGLGNVHLVNRFCALMRPEFSLLTGAGRVPVLDRSPAEGAILTCVLSVL